MHFIPRANKIMALFVSEQSPPLQRLLRYAAPSRAAGQPISDSELSSLTNLGRGTPANWAAGKSMSDKAPEVFVKVLNFLEAAHARNLGCGRADISEYHSLQRTISLFGKMYRDANLKVHQAAEMLGMPVEQAQRTIERSIYDAAPAPLTSIWYPPERLVTGVDRAKIHLKRYAGAYLVMLRRTLDDGRCVWLQCPLHVRYLADVKSGHRFLRAKLCYPVNAAADNATYVECDGSLTVLEHALDWRFETRTTEPPALLTFATHAEGTTPALAQVGSFVAAGFGEWPATASGAMYLEFMFADAADPYQRAYRSFMATNAKVIDDAASIAKIEQRRTFLSRTDAGAARAPQAA